MEINLFSLFLQEVGRDISKYSNAKVTSVLINLLLTRGLCKVSFYWLYFSLTCFLSFM
jgi:hypothetical protein